MRARTFFLWMLIGSLGVAGAVGVMALLSPVGRLQERVLITALLVSAFSLATLMCAVVIEKGRVRGLMWTGIGCAVLALAGWLTVVWWPGRFSGWVESLVRVSGALTILAALAGHFGLIGLPVLHRPLARHVRLATRVCAIALAALLMTLCIDEDAVRWIGERLYFRALGVFAILTGVGTIAVPLFKRIESQQRTMDEEATVGPRTPVQLTCPRCGTMQCVTAGRSRCSACRLGFRIEFEEPRCGCGYLLYGLTVDKCPECGAEAPSEKRWAPALGAAGGPPQATAAGASAQGSG